MISVIIPAYNEHAHIKATIQRVWHYDTHNLVEEIIVVDGGSSDATVTIARSEGVKAVVSPEKGRAAQMNYGASIAKEEILYFLHADTVPVMGFTSDIRQAMEDGYDAGCFMLDFDHAHWFLKFNCWFTRFDVDAFHYGDQSLFVECNHFHNAGGFCEKHIIFEDYHIIKQLKKRGRFTIVKKQVITSARKYLDNGIYKMQGVFYLMYFLYKLGLSQPRLVATYTRLINQEKI
ncbi:MAG: TIGR04283 family arsenosugar biosynthesis glycosyltransferase [Flavisolibacter sp.]|nr:TIGR04283 family arsenosugar biosynthesis glycosyltransferase [Flavisolibacter sp.]